MQLKDKKVIVTGGSDGYGKGIAKVFHSSGSIVWITGRNEEKLKKTDCWILMIFQ